MTLGGSVEGISWKRIRTEVNVDMSIAVVITSRRGFRNEMMANRPCRLAVCQRIVLPDAAKPIQTLRCYKTTELLFQTVASLLMRNIKLLPVTDVC